MFEFRVNRCMWRNIMLEHWYDNCFLVILHQLRCLSKQWEYWEKTRWNGLRMCAFLSSMLMSYNEWCYCVFFLSVAAVRVFRWRAANMTSSTPTCTRSCHRVTSTRTPTWNSTYVGLHAIGISNTWEIITLAPHNRGNNLRSFHMQNLHIIDTATTVYHIMNDLRLLKRTYGIRFNT